MKSLKPNDNIRSTRTYGDPRELPDNPKKTEKIAENGYQSAILSHSWENRAMELLTRLMTDDGE